MDDHRRVEQRGIVGTGMATDPESIEELVETANRRKRSEKPKPKKTFHKVFQEEQEHASKEDKKSP